MPLSPNLQYLQHQDHRNIMSRADANALIESVFPTEFGLSLRILLILPLQGVTVNALDTDT